MARLNSAKVAESWLGKGILTVPIRAKSKRPKHGEGWNDLRINSETINQYFKPGDNVGGLWGKPSNWIVDLDLDWDEACDAALYLLPETFIYGRHSRPNSHYLFKCVKASGSKRALKSGEVIAEIRSTGSQSVLPPSLHPDNERYEINHDVDIIEISRVELERYLDKVSAAAVFIRNYPRKGSRHDYIHALTGALMWGGWKLQETEQFLKAVIENIDDNDLEQRRRTVKNTLEHFKQGDRIQGWTTLEEWIEAPVIEKLKRWLFQKVKFEQPPRPRTENLHEKRSIKFDPNLLKVDGLVGEIAEWSKQQSFLLQPAFDLATGLMCTALASCNNYLVQGWDTPLQPYFMLVAPTSAGKGASLEAVYQFAKQIGLNNYVFQGFQSYYALLDILSESPNMACWLWDEAARHLAASKSPNSIGYSTVSHLISLYGRANSFVPGVPGRKNAIPPLDNPFLTLFATAQPDILIEAVSTATVVTGFVNRILLFDAGDGVEKPNLRRTNLFPSSLKRKALALKQHEPKRGNRTLIKYDSSVYSLLLDFDAESRKRAAAGDESSVWGRANQSVLILAGIYAVGLNPANPHITVPIVEWAIALVEWSINCWLTRIGENSSRSRREGSSKRVESLIRRTKALQGRAGTKSKYKDLMIKGQMPRAILQRLCRDISQRDLDDILDQLIEADLIGITEDAKGLITFWPKV